MLTGKKGNNPGIVFAPYIWMKNWRRKSRIEKIYKIEKPTEE